MICRKCGAKINENNSFCVNCGARVESFNQGVPPISGINPPAPNGGSNKGLMIALISVLGAILIAIIVVLICFLPGDEDTTVNGNGSSNSAGNKTKKQTVSTYYAYNSNATWEEAKEYAINDGGHLVYINNAKEFADVCRKADEANLKVFWVGARKSSDDLWDDVKWLDGSNMTFTNWYPSEPSYYDENGDDENWLMVFNVNGTWYYNDANVDVSSYYNGKMGYIVEVEEEYE